MKPSQISGFMLILLCSAAAGSPARPPTYIHIPSGQHQLFLDDFMVGALYRVERRVNPPVKYEGNPVVRADQPWEHSPGPRWNPGVSKSIQIRSAPCWDPQEKVWKMWYAGAGKTGFARSRDGIHWEKPSLGKLEFQGSTDNNLVVVRGEPETRIQHVLLDPDAGPERRYKGFTGPHNRHPLISSDGYEFTKLDVPVIPSQDESHLNYDEVKKRFIATVKHRGPLRPVGLPVAEHRFRELDRSRAHLPRRCLRPVAG